MASLSLNELIGDEEWSSVIDRILTHPLETRKTSTITFKCGTTISSLLPIHNVCMRQPPLRIVAFFIGICHETLEMADELGRLALHYAVRFGASHEVVKFLLAAAPRAAFTKTADGSLPIHLACSFCKSPFKILCISNLIFANPESLMIPNGHGRRPIDLVQDNPSDLCRQLIITILENGEKRLWDLEGCDWLNDETPPPNIDPNRFTDRHQQKGCEQVVSGTTNRSKENAQSKLCVVCMEHDVSHVCNPCGHVCLCSNCSTQHHLKLMKWRCPECRSLILGVIRFYGRVLLEE